MPLNLDGLEDDDDDEGQNPFSKQKGRRAMLTEADQEDDETNNEFWTSRVRKNHPSAHQARGGIPQKSPKMGQASGSDTGRFGMQRFE